MSSQLIIHAPNVHSGGGKILLLELLSGLLADTKVTLQLDARFPYQNENCQIYRVKPTVWDRLKAEWRLLRLAQNDTLVLCFGNLPPLFSVSGNIQLFIQNRYLVEKRLPKTAFIKERMRLFIERLWLRFTVKHANQVIVQSPEMVRLVNNKFKLKKEVKILTLLNGGVSNFKRAVGDKNYPDRKYDFLYVSSGEAHKNHLRLVEAWKILARENLFPSLCLTLYEEKYHALLQKIELDKQKFGLKIDNIFYSDRKSYKNQLHEARALIFPSLMESFGLPLVEAREEELPILAGECGFIRDVIDPEETFDPKSPISIARAVKRFLKIDEPELPFVSGKEFIEAIR